MMFVSGGCSADGCRECLDAEVGPDVWDETYVKCSQCGATTAFSLTIETRAVTQ